MPSMADITVKNVANADVVYTAATPSAGDTVPAVWTQNAAPYVQFRPEFKVLTRWNSKRNGRVFRATYRYPYFDLDPDTNQPILFATIPFEISGTLPTNIDVAAVTEAFTQMGNLMVSTLVRSVATTGYAPT